MTLPRKTKKINCGSNPGPPGYMSHRLPLSHTGLKVETMAKYWKLLQHKYKIGHMSVTTKGHTIDCDSVHLTLSQTSPGFYVSAVQAF